MIQSFRDKDAQTLFERTPPKRLPSTIHRAALRKLLMLDAATALKDLLIPPGNRLERLRGNRSETYSIRINDQWRICFAWKNGHAHDVEIIDYH